MMVGRGAKRKGTRYFGPYSHAWAIRETVDLLLRVFPMRSLHATASSSARPRSAGRACSATSTSARRPASATSAPRTTARSSTTSATSWAARPGRSSSGSRRRCTPRPTRQDYEKAARLRDDLGAMERALEKQAVVLGDGTDADVIALAEDPLEVAVQIFYVRGGRIRGQRGWVADRVDEGGTAELVEDFLLQLYAGDSDSIPREILVPALPPDVEHLRAAARRPAGRARCRSGCPQRGDKKTLQETVARNARQALALHKTKRASDLTTRNRALEEIQEALELDDGAAADRVLRRLQPPGHRGGRLDGGLRGRPGPQERVPPVRDQGRRRPERRRLDARGDHPPVPAAARRAGRVASSTTAPTTDERSDAGRPRDRPAAQVRLRPGLVVVDGGPPQVAAAQRALDELGIDDIPVCGLAKRLEEVWLPGQEDPVILRRIVRGALPAPADPRRGAPVRDHPPPLAALQVDGREPARRRARASARCAARPCSSTSAR